MFYHDMFLVELRHHLQKFAPELSRPIHIDYGADLQDSENTVEYDVISVSAVCTDRIYQHSHYSYPEVVFHLRMRRRTTFYTFNLLLPCVTIAILAVMTFLLPPECRERISLSITTLLALTLFFLLISETSPPTSLAVPLIGKFLLFTVALITLSTLLTVLVLNVHFRSAQTHSMSERTRKIFLEVLPPLIGLRPPKQQQIKNCPKKVTISFILFLCFKQLKEIHLQRWSKKNKGSNKRAEGRLKRSPPSTRFS